MFWKPQRNLFQTKNPETRFDYTGDPDQRWLNSLKILAGREKMSSEQLFDPVASLELVSPGAATDGVTLFFFEKN